MITLHGYSAPLPTVIVAAVATLWLLLLFVAAVSWERHPVDRMFRRTDRWVLIATLLFGAAWFYSFGHIRTFEQHKAVRVVSCATVAEGDREGQVKEKLGAPDEIRGEEETRGPAANVWIYKQAGCAVHLFGDRVDSVE